MGFFADLAFKREANKEFRVQVAITKFDIARHCAAEEKAKLKFDKLVELQETGKVDEQYFRYWNPDYFKQIQVDSGLLGRSIAEAKQEYVRWQQVREKTEKALSFMRPNTREDIVERRSAFANLAQDVLSVDPDGLLDLRFHSTTLASTKDILQSGGLISSVDRLDGFMETTNSSNEISVTEIQNVQYGLNFWTDIKGYNGCRPCGCMFVLQPRSQDEADMIRGKQMHNVLFHEHPEQLIAIATASENVERVQMWLQDNGLSPDIVCRFDALVKVLEKKKKDLAPVYRKPQKDELVGEPPVSSVDALISGAQARAVPFRGKTQDYLMDF